jgi:hypothetical protein
MSFTITTIIGANGTVVPDVPAAEVPAGEGYLMRFLPFEGYRVADVVIDSVSQGPLEEYLFTNVQANHTVEVSYALSHYRAVSNYSLENLVDPVDPSSTPQYNGIKVKFKVSTPSVASNAAVLLFNLQNQIKFTWGPETLSLSYETDGQDPTLAHTLPNTSSSYWVELRVHGKSVQGSVKGQNGENLVLQGELNDANDLDSAWVVSVDSSASGPGVNETLITQYSVTADGEDGASVYGSYHNDTFFKTISTISG